MTPAEQGQEIARDLMGGDSEIRAAAEQRIVALEQELEMCQRYFPFLQRSRADYKRRYEECQEELEQADNGYASAVTRIDGLLAARDEAVKRVEALVEVLKRIAEGETDLAWRNRNAEAIEIARAALDQSGRL